MSDKPFWKKVDSMAGIVLVAGLAVYFVGKSVMAPDCEEISKQIVAEIAAEQEAVDARTDINVYQKMQIKGNLRTSVFERLKEAGCEDWSTNEVLKNR